MVDLYGAFKDEKSVELIKNAETQLDGAESYIRQLENAAMDLTNNEKAVDAYVSFMVHLADLRRDLDWLSSEL